MSDESYCEMLLKELLSSAKVEPGLTWNLNQMLALSLVKCIEIVGEAASRVTRERQNQLPQIPWSQIIGMRNRLIHAYFQIDFDIVWDTVTQILPVLIAELEEIIATEEQEQRCN